MRKNTAGQYIAFQAISKTDGSDVTTGSPSVYYTIDGGTQATTSSSAIHEGNGQWSVALTQAETNGDHIVYTFVLTNAVSQTVNVYTVDADLTNIDAAISTRSTFDPASDTVANVSTVASVSGAVGSVTAAVTTDSASRTASQADVSALATSAALATAQADLDTLTGTDGVTLATSQPNYAPNTTTPPTAAAVADAVWDEARSAHTSVGSFGEGVKVESLNTQAKADVNAEADTAVSDASLATAAALATVDSNVDAILVDTGTTLPGTLTTMTSKIDTIDGIVDAILLDTGTDGVVISTAQAQTLADEVLKRSVTNTQDSADAHSLAAIVLGILESSRSSTTWTIKKTTGSTFTTKTLTLDATANPVTGVT